MKSILPFLLIIHISIFAGPNKTAKVYLDFDYQTEFINDELPYIESGQEYIVAVVAENVTSLCSYSCKISYNNDVVSLSDAVKKVSLSEKAFIESKGGRVAAFLTIPIDEGVEIAVTLSKTENKNSVNGKGVLAYLLFNGQTSGDPGIELTEVNLVDNVGNMDILKSKSEK